MIGFFLLGYEHVETFRRQTALTLVHLPFDGKVYLLSRRPESSRMGVCTGYVNVVDVFYAYWSSALVRSQHWNFHQRPCQADTRT